jgi:hypothetical protein
MAPRKPKRRKASAGPNRQKTGKPGKCGGRRRTSFKPGQSGNPKGRPPLPLDYKLAMNDRIGPKGLAALEAVLDNPQHPRHEQAAEYAVNRWKGTPTVKTEVSGPDGGPLAVREVRTSDERRARLRELEAKAAALVAGTAKAAKPGSDDPDGSD